MSNKLFISPLIAAWTWIGYLLYPELHQPWQTFTVNIMGSGWNWFTFKQKLLSMNWSYRFSGFVFSILYFSPIHLWWRHQTEVVRVQVSQQCPPCPRPRPSQQTPRPHPRQPEYRDIGPDTSKLWTLWTLWTTCQCGVSLTAPHNSSKLRSPEQRCKCYDNNNNMCL